MKLVFQKLKLNNEDLFLIRFTDFILNPYPSKYFYWDIFLLRFRLYYS